jgi:hypothetical protein
MFCLELSETAAGDLMEPGPGLFNFRGKSQLRVRRRLRAKVRFDDNGAGKKEVEMLGIGSEAPAFSVQDHHGETVRLADLRGQKVLLWFYPKADTPG